MSFEFIFYDSTVILIIANFLDSAHDQEWNEPIILDPITSGLFLQF